MKANRKYKSIIHDKSGYIQAVGALVALLVTIGVGAIVFFEITSNFDCQADADEAINNTEEMAGTVFELLPIVALVVVAAIIIGVVVSMGGGDQVGGGKQ